jgi:uncharacterized protein (DUF1919 family)
MNKYLSLAVKAKEKTMRIISEHCFGLLIITGIPVLHIIHFVNLSRAVAQKYILPIRQ